MRSFSFQEEPPFPVNTKNSKYTVLGVTFIDGTPLMCVLIIQGIEVHAHDCSGIDILSEPVGDVRDEDFVKKNTGKENFILVNLMHLQEYNCSYTSSIFKRRRSKWQDIEGYFRGT